jgi:glycogen debranching enzyme
VGLRSLASQAAGYVGSYAGGPRERDAVYHQGTVWSWLIGPYIDARMRVRPDDTRGALSKLEGLVAHLSDACVGNISEVFDAEPPYMPGGCIAQAWGVAELLRCLVRLTQKRS